jgi:glycosyltransferase involved in cell wall biosynthesis
MLNSVNKILQSPISEEEITQTSMHRKLKICLLGYRSNPFSGGQGIYIRYLSRALQQAGHSVDVISGQPYPILDEGIRLIKLPSLNLFEEESHIKALKWKHLASFTDFFEWFSMATGGFPEPYTFGRRLKKYFKKYKPDYDIVHDNQSLCYGTLALQKNDIALVTTIHHPITSDLSIALANETNWQMRLLIKRWHSFLGMQKNVVSKLKHIVTVSEVSRRDIADAFKIPTAGLKVVHNGIDTETFKPQPEITRVPYRIMATASADQPLKGLQYLLRAIAELAFTYPDIHLEVLGKLKPAGDTEKLVNELNLRKHLTFTSGVETQEVVNMYARASLVVVPSVYEGFGLPAGEAMSCGVPVISTNGGALPEVVGGCGIIVPVRDPEAIARAIEELINNPDKRSELSKRGRERILKYFSWKVAAHEMVDLYHEVLEKQ